VIVMDSDTLLGQGRGRESIPLSIIYPTDPLGPKVGGIETFMKGFIKYAPDEFDIEFVGISSDRRERPIGQWQKLRLGEREFKFYPLFFEQDENIKTFIPLSLRFTLALKRSGLDFRGRVLNFHRPEPALLFGNSTLSKVVFLHNDMRRYLDRADSGIYWKYFPGVFRWMERNIIRDSQLVYLISQATFKLYRSLYADFWGRVFLLDTYVDADIFFPGDSTKRALRQELMARIQGLSVEGEWILFVGRLQQAKAPLRLIDTFATYHKEHSASSLLIIGEGNLEQKTREQVKHYGLDECVHFLGARNQEEIAKFYRASDVLLLTSNFEGMPIVMLEALASGIPVVSTNAGEVKRVVKNDFSGEVVDDLSPQVISQALVKVLSNPSIYSKENCLASVSPYTCSQVLTPVYHQMRELYNPVRDRVTICGVDIDRVSFLEAVWRIETMIKGKTPGFVATPNVDHIMKLQRDGSFKNVYRQAALAVADGVPLLWAARFLNTPLKGRVNGTDLFEALCERSEGRGYRLFFLGGRPGAAKQAAEVLTKRHPHIQIVGTYSPPFGFEDSAEESNAIIRMIKEAAPDILFVGVGSPKQEKWMSRYMHEYNVPVSIGIGVSFELVAGMVKRAPLWMQRRGLEWLWRLAMEPARLFKRYLIDDAQFFWLVARQKYKKALEVR